MEFLELAALFNFTMARQALTLDDATWIAELDTRDRGRVAQALSNPELVISRTMLADLRFAIFHRFYIPTGSRQIAPPDQDLALDAELALRILKPIRVVDCGYLEYRDVSTSGDGGSRLRLQFPWTGPTYVLEEAEAEQLPRLWADVRRLTATGWIRNARFFQTARNRLLRAGREQDTRQRLLDLFIAIESLILRAEERWGTGKRGSRRVAMLLEPIDADARQALMDQCEWAHQQRNTVAHGVDRDLAGFDGSPATFDQLVWKVDAWGRETVFRVLRLLNEIGTLEEVLTCLDAGTTDSVSRTRIANALRGEPTSLNG